MNTDIIEEKVEKIMHKTGLTGLEAIELKTFLLGTLTTIYQRGKEEGRKAEWDRVMQKAAEVGLVEFANITELHEHTSTTKQ